MLTDLQKRTLFSIIAIPLVVSSVVLQGWTFFLLISGVVCGALYEYRTLLRKKEIVLPLFFVWTGGLLICFNYTSIGFFFFKQYFEFLFFILFLFFLLYEIICGQTLRVIERSAAFVFGLFYIAYFGSFLLRIGEEMRYSYVLIMMILVWCNDLFAYFSGRFWGKHFIVPKISPKKTWEGWVGGWAGTFLAGFIIQWFWPMLLSGWQSLILSVLIGVVGPLGDLFESLLKRDAQVKDTSQIFPGHGGILDRIDSQLLCAPAVYFYFKIFCI